MRKTFLLCFCIFTLSTVFSQEKVDSLVKKSISEYLKKTINDLAPLQLEKIYKYSIDLNYNRVKYYPDQLYPKDFIEYINDFVKIPAGNYCEVYSNGPFSVVEFMNRRDGVGFNYNAGEVLGGVGFLYEGKNTLYNSYINNNVRVHNYICKNKDTISFRTVISHKLDIYKNYRTTLNFNIDYNSNTYKTLTLLYPSFYKNNEIGFNEVIIYNTNEYFKFDGSAWKKLDWFFNPYLNGVHSNIFEIEKLRLYKQGGEFLSQGDIRKILKNDPTSLPDFKIAQTNKIICLSLLSASVVMMSTGGYIALSDAGNYSKSKKGGLIFGVGISSVIVCYPFAFIMRHYLKKSIKKYNEVLNNQLIQHLNDKRDLIKNSIENNTKLTDSTKKIETSKLDVDFYIHVGITKVEEGDFEEAIKNFSKAIEINPKDARAYILRGDTKGIKHDYNGAIADHSLAIEINPNNADLYDKRGLERIIIGQKESGCEDFHKASVLGSKDAVNELNKYCK